IAGGQLDAIRVMWELYREFRDSFDIRIRDQKLKSDPLQISEIQISKQLVDRIALFESSNAQTLTLTFEKAGRTASEVAGEVGGGTLLAKFIAKLQREHSHKDGIQLSVRSPTPTDLADICGIIAETLLRNGLIRHMLVLLDDIDLLETYQSPQQNARVQR